MGRDRKLSEIGFAAVATVLFSAAASAQTTDSEGLLNAARQNDTNSVRSFVDKGVDANTPEGDGFTPLHWASRHGNLEMFRVLLAAGADVGAVTRRLEHTPLHVASDHGNVEAMKVLVEAGSDVQARSTTGVTPLHLAARSGIGAAVALLLEASADVNAREYAAGQTALMFAAAANRAKPVRVLLERGAGPELQSVVVNVVERDRADAEEQRLRNERLGYTGGEAVIRVREREPTEGNEPHPRSVTERIGYIGGLTALHYAVREGHVEVVEALINGGADVDRVSADESSPLLLATLNGHWDLGLRLLEAGANPNVLSNAGTGPLYAAINLRWIAKAQYPQPTAHANQAVGYLEYMEALLEAGAKPNARVKDRLWYDEYSETRLLDTTGATPFWRAAYALDVNAMRLLLSWGADPTLPTMRAPEAPHPWEHPDSVDHSGLSPVPVGGPSVAPLLAATGAGYSLRQFAANSHRVAPGGWLRAVKFLVEEIGVDINARDHFGFNAVHNAATRGDVEVLEYLIDKGADLKAVSRSGLHTADMANSPQQRVPQYPEARDLLLSLGSGFNDNCVGCGL